MKLYLITKALGLEAYIEDDEWKDDEYDNTHLVVTDYSNFKKFTFEIWPTSNKKPHWNYEVHLTVGEDLFFDNLVCGNIMQVIATYNCYIGILGKNLAIH